LVPAVANAPPPYRPPFIAYPSPYTPHMHGSNGGAVRPPPPMIMAVDYSHGAAMAAAAAAGHAHPQFIAAGPPHGHPGGPTRLFIPVIPVMYNKPPPLHLAPAATATAGKAAGKTTTTPLKIAPRLHH